MHLRRGRGLLVWSLLVWSLLVWSLLAGSLLVHVSESAARALRVLLLLQHVRHGPAVTPLARLARPAALFRGQALGDGRLVLPLRLAVGLPSALAGAALGHGEAEVVHPHRARGLLEVLRQIGVR